MDVKNERVEFRLTAREREALFKLADKGGTSVSDRLRAMIRKAAQRERVWR